MLYNNVHMWDFWQGLQNRWKTAGVYKAKRLRATALKLFILQEQKHKTRSKIQMKKFSCGK